MTDYKKLWQKSRYILAKQHNTINSLSTALGDILEDKEIGSKAKELTKGVLLNKADLLQEEVKRFDDLLTNLEEKCQKQSN